MSRQATVCGGDRDHSILAAGSQAGVTRLIAEYTVMEGFMATGFSDMDGHDKMFSGTGDVSGQLRQIVITIIASKGFSWMYAVWFRESVLF